MKKGVRGRLSLFLAFAALTTSLPVPGPLAVVRAAEPGPVVEAADQVSAAEAAAVNTAVTGKVPLSDTGTEVMAGGVIGEITCGGSTRSYSSFKTLASDLKKNYENKTVTIDMKGSWNAARSADFDCRLFIPQKARVTLNMHGFLFNRNNAWRGNDDDEGENIVVDKEATLIINGGTEAERNSYTYSNVAVYNAIDPSGDKANGRKSFGGGLITGGCSSKRGGGIHARIGTTVVLNDVTIAGCGQTSNGKGGGIWMYDDHSTLRLNNSRISGCWASSYGGGVCINNDDDIIIELNNSSIDQNYCEENGGGIYVAGEKLHIAGRNGSQIRNNFCGEKGGGIFIWNDETSVTGLEINYNNAEYGGGIYTVEEDITLSNLKVRNNWSTSDGGGIYIENDGNTIAGCEITGNRSGGDGAGVFVSSNVDEDFNVTGKTIIRDNSAKGMGNQLYISDSDPGDTHINFNLTKGADVYLAYGHLGNMDSVMVTQKGDAVKSPNCIQYLSPSNKGWHFTYNPSPDSRKIYYVRDGRDSASTGKRYEKPADPTPVAAGDANDASNRTGDGKTKAGVIGQVGPGGEPGSNYDLVRAFSHHESTDDGTEDTDTVFYYSDAFFDPGPENYNDHLATASLAMAFSGMYLRALEPEDANGNTYYNKHAGARQFMADIGCPDQYIYVNESNEKVPGTDTMGVTIASKKLRCSDGFETGYTLIPIVTRGGGYEREWASNGTLDSRDDTEDIRNEARGFSTAASIVEEEVDKYIRKYALEDEIAAGKVKFWISGYSRGGATANIVAKRLVDKYADGNTRHNKVYAYTCEAPMGGADYPSDQGKEYYCIHNILNAVDIVPLVAPEKMGFKRYGVDHYIPGEEYTAPQRKHFDVYRGDSSGSRIPVTTWADNKPDYVKNGVEGTDGSGKKTDLKARMMEQLRAVDSSIIFDDYFHPARLDFLPSTKTMETGNYDNNHAEEFVKAFIRFAMEGFDEDLDKDKYGNWSSAVKNRSYFASDLQPAIRDTLALVFTMSDSDTDGVMGRASSIMGKIPTMSASKRSMADIYEDVMGGVIFPTKSRKGWHEQTPEKKKEIIRFFWDLLVQVDAFEFLDEADVKKLEKNWPKLAELAFTLANADYNYYPGLNNDDKGWAGSNAVTLNDTMMFLGTFMTYADYILLNHYPEVNLAWARAYDSYYEKENAEYRITNSGYSVNSPSAFCNGKRLSEGSNRIIGDCRMILDVEDIAGEAVYYDLKDESTGKTLAKNLLYRGGVDLTLGGKRSRDYTLSCYAISYGIRSPKAQYRISLAPNHRLTVNTDSGSAENYYRENDLVTIASPVPENRLFKHWDIQVLDSNDNPVTGMDYTEAFLDDEERNRPKADLTMPAEGSIIEAGGMKYPVPEGYSLVADARYRDRITKAEVLPDVDGDRHVIAPVAGEPLTERTRFTFTAGDGTGEGQVSDSGEYRIIWTYEETVSGEQVTVPVEYDKDEEGIIITPKAKGDTVYKATVIIPEDMDKDIAFVSTENLSACLSDAEADKGTVSISRNDADGSAIVTVSFNTTEEEPGPAPGPGPDPAPPPEPVRIDIKTYDINDRAYGNPRSYHSYKGSRVCVPAPEVLDEVFLDWDYDGSAIVDFDWDVESRRVIGVTVPEDYTGEEVELTALYYPVVKSISVNLAAPAAGKKIQTEAVDTVSSPTVKIGISDEYVIHPDNISIGWTPKPQGEEEDTAAKGTAYTAAVSLVYSTDSEGNKYIQAKKAGEGEGYRDMTGIFAFSKDPGVKVNGNGAAISGNGMTVVYTFPETESKYRLVSVNRTDDIEGVENGTDEEGIRALLPDTAKLLVEGGVEIDADVSWELSSGADDPRQSVVWTAKGSVTLPENVDNPDSVSLETVVRITTEEAEYASSPYSTLASGVYAYDQVASLVTTQEGGTTYYTMDGTKPSPSDYLYSGEDIIISREDEAGLQDETYYLTDEEVAERGIPDDMIVRRGVSADGIIVSVNEVKTGRKMRVLKAYTVRNGMWDSEVATYIYVFDNVIAPPSGKSISYNGAEQKLIAETGFYTISRDSLPPDSRIDEDGVLLASKAGEYPVTLHIKDGWQWKIETAVSGGSVSGSRTDRKIEYTDEDQVVVISINRIPLDDAVVTVLEDPVMIREEGYAAPEVSVTLGEKELEAGRDYEAVYSDNTTPGKPGRVLVEGRGNYCGRSGEASFGIFRDYSMAFSHSDIPDQVYTGKRIKPAVKVYYAGKLLTPKKDYTIQYKDNINAYGHAYIAIRGKGDYSGYESSAFRILEKDIGEEDVVIAETAAVRYNAKKAFTPVPKIRYNGMKLKKGKDFTITYHSNPECEGDEVTPKEPGSYYAKISGIKNYTGTVVKRFDIAPENCVPVSRLRAGKIKPQTYTGDVITISALDLVIKDGKKVLTEGVDYTAVCEDYEIGTGHVVITGNAGRGYIGVRTLTFRIKGIPIKKAGVEGFVKSFVYDGKEKVQYDVTLSYRPDRKTAAVRLLEDENYRVTYEKNVNAGKAVMILTGINGYEGTKRMTFRIKPLDIRDGSVMISVDSAPFPYARSGVKPKPSVSFNGKTLTEGIDYRLSYADNRSVNDGTGRKKPVIKVTGKGNFTGTDRDTVFAIGPADMQTEGVTVAADDVVFKDKPGRWKSRISLYDREKRKLRAGKDYDSRNIRYSYDEDGREVITEDSVVPAGKTVYVSVNAAGRSYTGYALGSYRVIAADRDVGKLKVKCERKLFTSQPVTISSNDIKFYRGKEPVEGVTFEILEETYKNNIKRGKARVTIRGTGEWGGKKTVVFMIGRRDFMWWWRE